MKKKLLALVLAVLMVVAMIPAIAVTASAAEPIVADTSWYDSSKTTFEIGTAAQLLGLSNLINKDANFNGKTIKLTADIDLNPGYKPGDAAPANVWGANPTADMSDWPRFGGTFDGQGHTVSGIYNIGYKKLASDTTYTTGNNGLFGTPSATTAVKNVTFKDCYMKAANQSSFLYNYTNGTAWSVTDVSFINVTLDSNNNTVALLMGGHNKGNCTVSGVFVDAASKVIGTGNNVAGLIGKVGGGLATFTDTVFLGTVKNNAASGWNWTGGFTGGVTGTTANAMPSATVSNCLFGGTIELAEAIQGTSGMLGECLQSESISIDNSASYGTWIGGKQHTHGLFVSRYGTTANVEGYKDGAKAVSYTFTNNIGWGDYAKSGITEYQQPFGQENGYLNGGENTTNLNVTIKNNLYATTNLSSRNINTGTYKATVTEVKEKNIKTELNLLVSPFVTDEFAAAGIDASKWYVKEGELPVPKSVHDKFGDAVSIKKEYVAPDDMTGLPPISLIDSGETYDDGALDRNLRGASFELKEIVDYTKVADGGYKMVYTDGSQTADTLVKSDAGMTITGYHGSGHGFSSTLTVDATSEANVSPFAAGIMVRLTAGENPTFHHLEVTVGGTLYQFGNGIETFHKAHVYFFNLKTGAWTHSEIAGKDYNVNIPAGLNGWMFIPLGSLKSGGNTLAENGGKIEKIGLYGRSGDSSEAVYKNTSVTLKGAYVVMLPTEVSATVSFDDTFNFNLYLKPANYKSLKRLIVDYSFAGEEATTRLIGEKQDDNSQKFVFKNFPIEKIGEDFTYTLLFNGIAEGVTHTVSVKDYLEALKESESASSKAVANALLGLAGITAGYTPATATGKKEVTGLTAGYEFTAVTVDYDATGLCLNVSYKVPAEKCPNVKLTVGEASYVLTGVEQDGVYTVTYRNLDVTKFAEDITVEFVNGKDAAVGGKITFNVNGLLAEAEDKTLAGAAYEIGAAIAAAN